MDPHGKYIIPLFSSSVLITSRHACVFLDDCSIIERVEIIRVLFFTRHVVLWCLPLFCSITQHIFNTVNNLNFFLIILQIILNYNSWYDDKLLSCGVHVLISMLHLSKNRTRRFNKTNAIIYLKLSAEANGQTISVRSHYSSNCFGWLILTLIVVHNVRWIRQVLFSRA